MNIHDAETLCRQLAPADLATTPVYVLAPRDLPPQPNAEHYHGWQSPNLDLLAMDSLRAAGRWQGRGVAVAVNVEPWHAIFRLVLIHELAHALTYPLAGSCVDEPQEIPPEMLRLLSAHDELPSLVATDNPWHGHEAAWIRVVCHLSHRLGIIIGRPARAAEFNCAGQRYGLSPAACYERALHGEPELYLDGKLAELCNCEPPEEFRQLWQADTNEPWTFGT